MKDITKEGSLNYKELQKENEETLTPEALEDIYKRNPELMVNRHGTSMPVPTYDELIPQDVYSPMHGETEFWGNSRFDDDVVGATDFYNNLQDIRAENQPWIAKLSAGLGKGVVQAGTTFLDGTVGLIAGLTSMGIGLASGEKDWYARLWDNDVSNALQEINQTAEEWMPNYRTEGEQNAKWYQNLGTVNFWADSFLKNMGFTVGAFYSGAAWTKGLKALGALKNALPAQVLGSTLSAVNEARFEANNNSDDWEKLEMQKLQDSYDRAVADFPENEEKYKTLFDAELEDLKMRKAKMGLTDFVTNTVLLAADNYLTYGKLYVRGFNEAKKNAKELGKNVGLKEAREAGSKALANESAEEMGKQITKEGKRYTWADFKTSKPYVEGLRTGLREGNEEMAQAFFGDYSGNRQTYDSPDAYYEAFLDPEAEAKTKDFLTSMSEAFMSSYGNPTRWEEGAVGFLTGIVGMPTFGKANNASANTYLGRGKAIGLSGGLFGGINTQRQANKEGKEAVDYMNKYMEKLEQNQHSLAASRSFTDIMDGWAAEGNAFEYKNAQDNDFFQAAERFRKVGRSDDLKEMVNVDFEGMTDDDLAKIAMNTTPKETDEKGNVVYDSKGNPVFKSGGWTDTDGQLYVYKDKEGNIVTTDEKREKMRSKLIEHRDDILKQLNAYNESVDKIHNMGIGDIASADQMSELAWLDWKVGRFADRFKTLRGETKDSFGTILKALDDNIEVFESSIKEQEESSDKDTPAVKQLIEEEKKILGGYKSAKTYVQTLSQSDNPMYVGKVAQGTQKTLDFLKSEEGYNAIRPEMNYLSYKKAMEGLSDMSKMVSAYETFNKRLQEFTEDPVKIAKNRESLEKKHEEKRAAASVVENRKAVKEMTREKIEELTDDELNEKIEAFKDDDGKIDEDDPDVKTLRAEQKRRSTEKALYGFIDELDDEAFSPEAKEAAKKAVSNARLSAEEAEEIMDLDGAAYLDPDLIDEGEFEGVESMTPEEIAEMKDARLAEIREVMNAAIEQANLSGAESAAAAMPDSIEGGEVIASVSAEEVTSSEEESKPSGATPTPASPVTPVNPSPAPPKNGGGGSAVSASEEGKPSSRDGNERLKPVNDGKKGSSRVFSIQKRASNILDDSGVNILPSVRDTYTKSIMRVLGAVKDMVKKKVGIDRALEALRSTEDFKKVTSTIPNFEAEVRSYYNDIAGKRNNNVVVSVSKEDIEKKPAVKNPTPVIDDAQLAPEDTSVKPEVEVISRGRYDFSEKQGDTEVSHKVVSHTGTRKVAGYSIDEVTFSADRTKTTKTETSSKNVNSGEGYILFTPYDIDYEAYAQRKGLNSAEEAKTEIDAATGGVYRVVKVEEGKDDKGNTMDIATLRTKDGKTVRVEMSPDTFEKIYNEAHDRELEEEKNEKLSEDDATRDEVSTTLTDLPAPVTESVERAPDAEFDGVYRPSLTQYPIHPDKGSDKKFWETIQDPEKRERYKKVTEYLEKAGAFARRAEGLVKPGMKIHFFIDKAFNESGPETFTIFYADSDGNILGDVSDESSSTLGRQGNLSDVIKAVKEEWEQAGKPEKFTSKKYSTSVKQTYAGHVPYTEGEYHSLNDIHTVTGSDGTSHRKPFTVGVVMRGKNGQLEVFSVGGRKQSDRTKEEINTRCLQNAKPGTPVLLMEAGYTTDSSNPSTIIKKYIAVPVASVRFNESFTDNEDGRYTLFNQALNALLNKLDKTISKNEIRAVKNALNNLFGFERVNRTDDAGNTVSESSLFIDKNNDGGLVIKVNVQGKPTVIYNGVSSDIASIKKSFYGLPIQISRKYINDEYKIGGTTIDYNDMIGGILMTNIAPGNTTLRNNFFTINPVEGVTAKKSEGTSQSADNKTMEVLGWIAKDKRLGEIWDKLPEEYQNILKGYNKTKFERTMKVLQSKRTLDGATLKKVFEGKNRIVDSRNAKPMDIKKELRWLAKVLPQFTRDERLALVEGLIKISHDPNSAYAWGQFKNGVITLSKAAARGTLYHEAFHAVVDTILSESDREELFKEAEKLYKTADRLALEEKLAEGFREYVQFRETPKGKIVKFFDKIKRFIDKIFNRASAIESLYYRINNGDYAEGKSSDMAQYNGIIEQTRAERLKFDNLDDESREYLAESEIAKETYDSMTLEEKENLLYCKI